MTTGLVRMQDEKPAAIVNPPAESYETVQRGYITQRQVQVEATLDGFEINVFIYEGFEGEKTWTWTVIRRGGLWFDGEAKTQRGAAASISRAMNKIRKSE